MLRAVIRFGVGEVLESPHPLAPRGNCGTCATALRREACLSTAFSGDYYEAVVCCLIGTGHKRENLIPILGTCSPEGGAQKSGICNLHMPDFHPPHCLVDAGFDVNRTATHSGFHDTISPSPDMPLPHPPAYPNPSPGLRLVLLLPFYFSSQIARDSSLHTGSNPCRHPG